MASLGTPRPPSGPNGTDRAWRVLIVDDHPVIREALAEALSAQTDLVVCGEASTADDALRLMRTEKPHVAIVDVSLQDSHGLDLVQNVRVQYPDVKVIMFSMYDESVYAERALRAGASAYLMKSEPTSQVVEAVYCVLRGEVYLSRQQASRLLSRMARPGAARQSNAIALEELTDREMAVLQMLGEGHSVNEIADRLSLGRKTVETYRRRAKEKLGFSSLSELLQYSAHWTYSQATGQGTAQGAGQVTGQGARSTLAD